MASLSVRRKSCLLRFRENCPFRKLRRKSHALSAAASTIGSYWDNVGPPNSSQPISTVSQPLPHLSSICPYSQSKAAADDHMEEDPPAEKQQNQSRAEDYMELNVDIDPETGERANVE